MADLLGIGSSALRSLQQALSTTGHNISNVGTEGYSRQRVDFATLPAQLKGGSYIGSGVTVSSIERVYDQFIEGEILGGGARLGQYEAYHSFSSRIDQLLASSGGNFSAEMQEFFAAAQNLAANPTGLPERQVLLSEAQSMVQRQQSLYGSVNSLNLEINERLNTGITEVNSLAESIARLNEGIISASAGGRTPNDLLDQRGLLLEQLSAKIGISTTDQQDGSVNVSIGNGYSLVIGSQARSLQTVTDPYDASRLDVYTVGPGAGSVSGQISGGELKGLLDFREQALDPVLNQLGLISLGLTETINQQHSLGVDLNGNLGGDIFQVQPASANPHTSNAGSALPAIQITDVGQLTDSDYTLRYSAGAWTLTRQSDGSSVTGGGPLAMDGMSIDLSSGVPTDGDSFLVRPTRGAAEGFQLQLSDPRAIAAAAPLLSSTTVANTGTGDLSELQVTDNTDLPLSGPVTLTFNPNALGAGVPGFDVSGGVSTTIAYDPATQSAGASFSLGLSGVSLTLSGIPSAGDTMTLANTAAGSGDNRNALAMAGLQFDKLLYGGSSTYTEAYSTMVTRVGVDTQSAANSLQLEGSLLQQAQDYRSSVSGVNLDEEATNLLKYQQQYQAAAQLVSVADELFQTLLNATGR